MDAKNNNMNRALKLALESRVKRELSSNFNHRMMEQIRLAAVKKRKRQAWISWTSLIAASLLLVGMAVYILIFYMKLDPLGFILRLEMPQLSSGLLPFYCYIAGLVLILLGLDYGMRHYQRKSTE